MDKEDDDGDETAGKTRFPCLPSLIALQQMRNRLNTATGGKRLMKWSALATGRELRRIAHKVSDIYMTFTEDVRNAYIALARCRYFYPSVNQIVLQNYPKMACISVTKATRSVAGSKVMMLHMEENCPDSYPYLGIDKGGENIYEAKRMWRDLLRRMIKIEQLRSNFRSLDIAHDNANKLELFLFTGEYLEHD